MIGCSFACLGFWDATEGGKGKGTVKMELESELELELRGWSLIDLVSALDAGSLLLRSVIYHLLAFS